MRDRDEYQRGVVSELVRRKILELEKQVRIHADIIEELEHQMEVAKASISVIVPGSFVKWMSRDRERYGVVKQVKPDWQGFDFHCIVLSKVTGKEVGHQKVDGELHEIEIVEDEKLLRLFKKNSPKPEKPKKKPLKRRR